MNWTVYHERRGETGGNISEEHRNIILCSYNLTGSFRWCYSYWISQTKFYDSHRPLQLGNIKRSLVGNFYCSFYYNEAKTRKTHSTIFQSEWYSSKYCRRTIVGNMKIYYNATLICKSGDLDIKLFRIYSLSRLEIYHNLSFLPDIWWECWSWRGTRVKVYCCFSMSWESNNYLLHSNCQLVYQSDTYLAPVCEPPSHWHFSTSCEQQGLLWNEVKSNSLNYNTQWTHERCTSVLSWAP